MTSRADRARAARLTPVEACASLLDVGSLLVAQDDDPITFVRRAAAQPQTRLIGVVDPAGILVGIVPTLRLAETVVARVSPETLLAGTADLDEATRFGTEVGARRVADIMLPPATVRPTDTVDSAFRLMHRRHLSGAYVIDERGKPVGYLDLLEVTLRYLEAIESGPSTDA